MNTNLTTVEPPEKSLFQTRTFWINFLTILIVVASTVVEELPKLGEGSIGILAIVNIILRVITKKPAYIL